MDIRGIEITNQLRSAIRAKLLELGVRYDEELPDYILVMVVNKKSRQQMHEDLHLFLEDSTTPFVEWLHDQVLKKLQKVTVAKRKSRELVPSVIVKQEEEKKKRKAATSFLEDQEKDDKELVQSSLQLVTSTVQEEEKSPEEEISQTPPSNSIPEDLPVELPSKEKDREREREGREREESPKRRDEENDESRRLKSSVIKPRITSVVSVKTRLGVSPKVSYKDKKYDSRDLNSRHRDDKLRNFSRRGSRSEPDSTRKDLRSRLGNSKPETPKYNPVRSREKDIRDRLGQSVNQKQPKEAEKEPRNPVSRNVKNRLGPRNQNSRTETVEEEEEEEVVGPVRSRIIAVKAAPQQKTAVEENEEEEEEELVKLPSKVIVTPRPLKPLQPAQKRATKSLLFRAIAEANQSVVMQKNPEPTITEKKPLSARLRTAGVREISNNLSVCLNKKSRFVMEKIQVEVLRDEDNNKGDKNFGESKITDEQMGVVKSLFNRGDESQTFLVTLNGHDDDSDTEWMEENEDEGLEMQVNESDELTVLDQQMEDYDDEDINSDENVLYKSKDTLKSDRLRYGSKEENPNIENEEGRTVKKRKLSPIIYTRSPSPTEISVKFGPSLPPKLKKPMIDSNTLVITDKSKEKCRYWPNCTLGLKCAFYHPTILCSAFPACKFGDKCAYQHPKCKFGTSCAKIGCIFVHPQQQCKYHPFCTKPDCTFFHPTVKPPVPTAINQRAKFTWRRQ